MDKFLVIICIVIVGAAIWVQQGKPTFTSNVPVSQAQAVEKVKALPEVKAYIARVKSLSGDPRVDVVGGLEQKDGSLNSYWTVRVYENLVDHIATDSIYEVDSKTGAVTQEI